MNDVDDATAATDDTVNISIEVIPDDYGEMIYTATRITSKNDIYDALFTDVLSATRGVTESTKQAAWGEA